MDDDDVEVIVRNEDGSETVLRFPTEAEMQKAVARERARHAGTGIEVRRVRPGYEEVEVTPEMIEAGLSVLREAADINEDAPDRKLVSRIFIAMLRQYVLRPDA